MNDLHNLHKLPRYTFFSFSPSPERVSGAERQNFPFIAQLHLQKCRSPLRSRSDDLPIHLFFKQARRLIRSAHLTFWQAPLRNKAS